MTMKDVEAAVKQLSQSEHGRDTLLRLSEWMDESGVSLDARNQSAVRTLLSAVWGPFTGSARDVMRDGARPPRRDWMRS